MTITEPVAGTPMESTYVPLDDVRDAVALLGFDVNYLVSLTIEPGRNGKMEATWFRKNGTGSPYAAGDGPATASASWPISRDPA